MSPHPLTLSGLRPSIPSPPPMCTMSLGKVTS